MWTAQLKTLTSWSIRRKLLLLTLVVFLPAAGIIGASGLERRQHEIVAARNNALLLVQSLAAQQEQITTGTKQMLSVLAHLPEVQRLSLERCNELFRDLRLHYPFYSTIGLTDPEGNLIASALPFSPGDVNIANQKHVKDVIATNDFSVGEYSVGMISRLHSIHYSYPVLDERNNLRAIVIAGFDLGGYASFISKADLPEDSVVVIADHRGVRLYRRPEVESAAVGKRIKDKTVGLLSGGSGLGVFESTGDDGVRRLYAFKRLSLSQGSPPYIYMMVGIAKERILHQADLRLIQSLAILGLLGLLAFSSAWLVSKAAIIKPVEHLVTATRRLGGGQLGARTNLPHTPDELGRLAASFDEMASLLEQKDCERRLLASKLLSTEEKERKRMAGELHDGLAGSLSGLKISLQIAHRALKDGTAHPELLDTPIAWTQHILDETRKLMADLRPTVLDDLGVIAAVQWFLRQYRTTYPEIHVEEELCLEENDIPELLKTVIFRMAQEAFHNIAKYSRAEFVEISLTRRDSAIELVIEDNGDGFDLEAALALHDGKRGLGLSSMRERCELSGGVFHMASTIGSGTEIKASWPVSTP